MARAHSYVLTLTTYADYIPEQEAESPLPKPVAPVGKRTSSTCSGSTQWTAAETGSVLGRLGRHLTAGR